MKRTIEVVIFTYMVVCLVSGCSEYKAAIVNSPLDDREFFTRLVGTPLDLSDSLLNPSLNLPGITAVSLTCLSQVYEPEKFSKIAKGTEIKL